MTMVIPREARRITYSSEIRALKEHSFTEEQRSIINGALLGDGCLYTAWKGTARNYRFSKMHSVKQKEYIDWTYNKLKPFVLTPPKLYKPTQAFKVQTISHPELTALYEQFYKSGKKMLPKHFCDIVADPLSLAVWFMDDGNRKMNNGKLVGYYLNTQSFPLSDHVRMVNIFRELYDIHAIIERNKQWYRIALFREPSRDLFRSLIEEHVIASMRYKLG